MTQMIFPFDNSYARLPDRFYARLAPTPVDARRFYAVIPAGTAPPGPWADR